MESGLPIFAKRDLLKRGRWVSYEQFRELLCYPTWNYFLQAIRLTRAYDEGLGVGMHLMNLNEEYKDKLTQKEYDDHTRMLCHLCLDMLRSIKCGKTSVSFLDATRRVWMKNSATSSQKVSYQKQNIIFMFTNSIYISSRKR